MNQDQLDENCIKIINSKCIKNNYFQRAKSDMTDFELLLILAELEQGHDNTVLERLLTLIKID